MLDKYRTPESITAKNILYKPESIHIPYQPERLRDKGTAYSPQVKIEVQIPDELKLVIFGGFVAMMAWFMLTVFVASFSQPRVIIVQPDGSIIRNE